MFEAEFPSTFRADLFKLPLLFKYDKTVNVSPWGRRGTGRLLLCGVNSRGRCCCINCLPRLHVSKRYKSFFGHQRSMTTCRFLREGVNTIKLFVSIYFGLCCVVFELMQQLLHSESALFHAYSTYKLFRKCYIFYGWLKVSTERSDWT